MPHKRVCKDHLLDWVDVLAAAVFEEMTRRGFKLSRSVLGKYCQALNPFGGHPEGHDLPVDLLGNLSNPCKAVLNRFFDKRQLDTR